MFGSAMLEVAIGLVMTYLLLGLACSTLNEFLARLTKLRTTALRKGIQNLLGDSDGNQMSAVLYRHPLIKGLAGGSANKHGPNWIPPRIFSAAILQIAGFGAPGDKNSAQDIMRTIGQIQDDPLKRSLQALAMSAEDDAAHLQLLVEEWFNAGMSQVTEWYKRRTQWIVLGISLVICSALNVDTIAIIRTLSTDPAMRASVVAAAEELSHRQEPGTGATVELEKLKKTAEDSGLPIGWKTDGGKWGKPDDPGGWVVKILGIALSIISVSLGAPFWFDVLNKLVRVRGSRGSTETRP